MNGRKMQFDATTELQLQHKRRSSTKLLASSLALVTVTVLLVLWSGGARAEKVASLPFFASGLVSVAPGQSVHLNVSHFEGIVPCTAEMLILDAEGLVVARTMMDLARGRSASLTLNRDTLGRTEVRLGLRAVVIQHPPDPQIDQRIPPDPQLVANFEVSDNATQRTVFATPVELKGFKPQPEPPAVISNNDPQ
ncbi:MAG TPA: hypothetical protein VF074_23925 [Pyrinomonadaceae bacterium]